MANEVVMPVSTDRVVITKVNIRISILTHNILDKATISEEAKQTKQTIKNYTSKVEVVYIVHN